MTDDEIVARVVARVGDLNFRLRRAHELYWRDEEAAAQANDEALRGYTTFDHRFGAPAPRKAPLSAFELQMAALQTRFEASLLFKVSIYADADGHRIAAAVLSGSGQPVVDGPLPSALSRLPFLRWWFAESEQGPRVIAAQQRDLDAGDAAPYWRKASTVPSGFDPSQLEGPSLVVRLALPIGDERSILEFEADR